MENLIFSLNAVLPLFLLMLTGWLLRRFRILPPEFFVSANKITFLLFLPAVLFLNIYDYCENFRELDWDFPLFAGAAVLITVITAMLTVPPLMKNKRQAGSVVQSIFRSNYLLFGLAVMQNMFGSDGVFSTTVLIPIVVPLFNIAAVIVLSLCAGNKGEKGLLKKELLSVVTNPLIIAALVGFLFAFFKLSFHFELPQAAHSTVKSFAAIGTPLALISLGGQFNFSGIKSNLKPLIAASLARLIIVPAIWLTVSVLLGYRANELGTLLTLFASPAAVSSFIMAEQSGCDGELAAQIVVFTTAFSAFTIFIFIYLFRTLGYI